MTDTHRTWTRVNGHGSYWPDAIAQDGQIVARVIGGGYPTGVGWSLDASQRADLIAAAPDMLAALEELVKSNFGQPRSVTVPALDNARAAIAKATGEETNA